MLFTLPPSGIAPCSSKSRSALERGYQLEEESQLKRQDIIFDQFVLVDHVALRAAAGVGPTECLLFVRARELTMLQGS